MYEHSLRVISRTEWRPGNRRELSGGHIDAITGDVKRSNVGCVEILPIRMNRYRVRSLPGDERRSSNWSQSSFGCVYCKARYRVRLTCECPIVCNVYELGDDLLGRRRGWRRRSWIRAAACEN